MTMVKTRVRKQAATIERWQVTLHVDRNLATDDPPNEWDWDDLLGGGNPVVLSAYNMAEMLSGTDAWSADEPPLTDDQAPLAEDA